MTRQLGAALLLAAGCGGGGGGGPFTELVVVVESDLDAPDEIDEVRLFAMLPDGEQRSETVGVGGAGRFPLTIGLRYLAGELGPITVGAEGLAGGEKRIARHVTTSFLPDESRIVDLSLLDPCLGVFCEAPPAEGDPELACVAGACGPPDVAPGELASYPGELPPAERCNESDDDGDGMIDETTVLAEDDDHCGMCGMGCAQGICASGLCDDGTIVQITAGAGPTCARRDSGIVTCWGFNFFGELGDGRAFRGYRARPHAVRGLSDAVDVAAGSAHVCAVRATGAAVCWGNNQYGQLGTGNTTDRAEPAEVTGLTGAVQVAASVAHSCAVRSDRRVSCWGDNQYDQLGNAAASGTSPRPVEVDGVTDAIAIGIGAAHSCVLRSGGTVACFGDNQYMQLGRTTAAMIDGRAADVEELSRVREIAIGPAHGCAVRMDGSVACWGNNSVGQLGAAGGPTAVTVPGLTGVTALSAGIYDTEGGDHTCAVHGDGTVSCWGRNSFYQIGTMSAPIVTAPTSVDGVAGAIGVAAGTWHSCALRMGGEVDCWGDNLYGQLGRWTIGDGTPMPAPVHGP